MLGVALRDRADGNQPRLSQSPGNELGCFAQPLANNGDARPCHEYRDDNHGGRYFISHNQIMLEYAW